MKKTPTALLCCLTAFLLAGCSSGAYTSDHNNDQSGSVSAVLEEKMAENDMLKDTQNAEPPKAEETDIPDTGSSEKVLEPSAIDRKDEIDVDLTVLSSTMVYSEVYNMMVYPDEYVGKTVKMTGTYAFYHDEASDMNYYACIIADATQCCAQGIEFILTDDYTYPDDYPIPGDEVTVTGVFDTYMEGEYTYCTLRGAKLG